MTKAINDEAFSWRDGLLESRDGVYNILKELMFLTVMMGREIKCIHSITDL